MTDFLVLKFHGSETASIVSNKLHLHVPDSIDSCISCWYHYTVPSGDFSIEVGFSNYAGDNPATQPRVMFMIADNEAARATTNAAVVDLADIDYYDTGGTHNIRPIYKINGAITYETAASVGSRPTKLRLRRIGTVFYFDYYTDSWHTKSTKDFDARAQNVASVAVILNDNANRGGEVDFDDLILLVVIH